MSAAPLAQPVERTRTAQPATERPARPGRESSLPAPPLRVVKPRRHAARAPFVVLVSLILGGGLVFLLLVNTWLAAGSFTIHALQSTQSSLSDQQQALAQTIASESTPQQLARRAAALGLVPAPNPVFRAPTGAVLGVQTAAQAPPKPVPSPTATPTASASSGASPSSTAPPSPSGSPSTSSSPSGSASPPAAPAAGAATKPSTSPQPKPTPTGSTKAAASPSAKAPVKSAARPSAKTSAAPSAKTSAAPSVKTSAAPPSAKASVKPSSTAPSPLAKP